MYFTNIYLYKLSNVLPNFLWRKKMAEYVYMFRFKTFSKKIKCLETSVEDVCFGIYISLIFYSFQVYLKFQKLYFLNAFMQDLYYKKNSDMYMYVLCKIIHVWDPLQFIYIDRGKITPYSSYHYKVSAHKIMINW